MANDMANDDANDMANEPTPLFDRVIGELGNPVPAEPIDRSYEAIVAIAEAGRAAAGAEPVKEAPAATSAAKPTKGAKSVPAPSVGADAASMAG